MSNKQLQLRIYSNLLARNYFGNWVPKMTTFSPQSIAQLRTVTLVAIECVDNCRACSLPAFNAQTCRVHCEIEMVLSCVAFQLNASVWAPLSPRRQSFKMALTSFAFYKVLYSITLIIIFPKSCLGDGSRFAFDVGLSGRGSTTSFSLSSSFNISAIRLCCEIEQWFSKLIWFPIK